MEGIIRAGMALDWISPLIALVQTWRNRPSVGFRVPADIGWDTVAVQSLLSEQGIASWGFLWLDDSFIFRIRLAQARYGEYVLTRASVPYTCSPYRAPSSHSDRASTSARRRAPRSTSANIESIVAAVARFTDRLGR